MSKEKTTKVYIQIFDKKNGNDWEAQPVILELFESREQAAFWARTTANIMEWSIRLSYPEKGYEHVKPTNLNGSYFSRAFDYKPKVFADAKFLEFERNDEETVKMIKE